MVWGSRKDWLPRGFPFEQSNHGSMVEKARRNPRVIIYILLCIALFYTCWERELWGWQEFMNDGPRRVKFRQQFLDSFKETGHMLLLKPPGGDYIPLEALGDDPGVYIAYVWCDSLGLTQHPIHNFWLLCLCPIALYLCGVLWAGLKGEPPRGYYAVVAGVVYLALTSLDVYVFAMVPTALFILILTHSKQRESASYLAWVVLFASLCAATDFVRMKMGLLLLGLMVLYQLFSSRRVLLVLALLVSYFGVSYVGSHQLGQMKESRNRFLENHYQAPVEELPGGVGLKAHAFWHAVYLGLAYDRVDGIVYHDTYPAMKIEHKIQGRAVKGGFYPIDKNYEQSVKQLYIETVKNHPFQALLTYVKKFLVVACFALLLSGLVFDERLSERFRPSRPLALENCTLLAACLVSLAPAVLVYPFPLFIVGAVSLAPGFYLLRTTGTDQHDVAKVDPSSDPSLQPQGEQPTD